MHAMMQHICTGTVLSASTRPWRACSQYFGRGGVLGQGRVFSAGAMGRCEYGTVLYVCEQKSTVSQSWHGPRRLFWSVVLDTTDTNKLNHICRCWRYSNNYVTVLIQL